MNKMNLPIDSKIILSLMAVGATYRIYSNKNTILYNLIFTYSWASMKLNKLFKSKTELKNSTEKDKIKYTYWNKGVLVDSPYEENHLKHDLCIIHIDKHRKLSNPNEKHSYYKKSNVEFICFIIKHKGNDYNVELNNSERSYLIENNLIDRKVVRYFLSKYHNIKLDDDENFKYDICFIDDKSEDLSLITIDQNTHILFKENNIELLPLLK